MLSYAENETSDDKIFKHSKGNNFFPKMTSYDKNETSHAKKFVKIFNMSRGKTFSPTVLPENDFKRV